MKHDSTAHLRSIPAIRLSSAALSIVLALATTFAAFGEQLGTPWTYQGQLRRSGVAYNGTCNFQFRLWDAASAGTQQAGTQSINGVSVVNGLFTVTLDFGQVSPIGYVSDFSGDARWLGTSVQCSGDGGFTPLDPRQPITAAPYALSLRPGATIIDGSGGYALRLIESGPGTGASALYARNEGAGHGIYGESVDGLGVFGGSSTGVGVFGRSGLGTAIFGRSYAAAPAIHGVNFDGGSAGRFEGRVEVEGPLTVLSGNQSTGVYSHTSIPNGIALFGDATEPNSAGVFGVNRDSAAIWGKSTGAGSAIYGQSTSTGFAGRFTGPVLIEGNLIVQGAVSKNAGSFRIDHPLNPANKFLSHSFVESADMKNIYDGNVTTDVTGSALVTLPDYFEALNRDYRYQLTVLGQFAQAIVSRKITRNSFEIRTDKPGVEVSWQVTGIRQDAYAQANPIVVEESKPAEEQGLYLFPAGFGASEEKQIGYPSRPATAPGAQRPPATGPGDQARSK